jgi:hypothetical protein
MRRMVREYDVQLLESVAVRRARMREVLLWGRHRRQLATEDNLKRFAIGLVLAAVASAGCVGWAYLQKVSGHQRHQSLPESTSQAMSRAMLARTDVVTVSPNAGSLLEIR